MTYSTTFYLRLHLRHPCMNILLRGFCKEGKKDLLPLRVERPPRGNILPGWMERQWLVRHVRILHSHAHADWNYGTCCKQISMYLLRETLSRPLKHCLWEKWIGLLPCLNYSTTVRLWSSHVPCSRKHNILHFHFTSFSTSYQETLAQIQAIMRCTAGIHPQRLSGPVAGTFWWSSVFVTRPSVGQCQTDGSKVGNYCFCDSIICRPLK